MTSPRPPAPDNGSSQPGPSRFAAHQGVAAMPAAAKPRPALTDAQLLELLGLIKGADSVELKLTVPEDEHVTTLQALGVDPLNAQIRQVFFFDTPDLDLYQAGVVPRARRIQGRPSDSVI